MTRTKSFFFHGFNSDKHGWDDLFSYWKPMKTLAHINAEKQGRPMTLDTGAAFPTEIIEWDSGKLGNTVIGLIELLLNRDKAFDLYEKWEAANEGAIDTGKRIASHINKFYSAGENIVISAHSLGSVAAIETVRNLNKNLNVYMFMMGGSASFYDYEEIIDRHENVKLAMNIYSTNDMVLDKILRQYPSLDPIGTTEISPERNIAINVKTNLSHSGYKDGAVTSIYRDFTESVKKHC